MSAYTRAQLDSGIASLQEWLDLGYWRTDEAQARRIYEWYVFIKTHDGDVSRLNVPLDFWIGQLDFPLDDNFDNSSDVGYNQPASTNQPNNNIPGSIRYPTLQGTVNTDYDSSSNYTWSPKPSKTPYEGHSGGLDDKRGTHALCQSDFSNNDQQGSSRYPTRRGPQDEYLVFNRETDSYKRKRGQRDPHGYLTSENYVLVPYSDNDDSQSGGAEAQGLESEDDEEEFHPEYYYQINPAGPPTYARKFRTERKHYRVAFRYTHELIDADDKFESIFDSILKNILADFTPDDMTGLQINHPALDTPIYIPLTKHSNLTGFKILAEIMKVQQSNTELAIDDDLEIRTVSVSPPNGTGWHPRRIDFDTWFKKCLSKIEIKNNDKLCMARAIVTAIAHCRKDPQRDDICKGDRGYATSPQKRLATELMQKAGLTNHQGPCGIPEAEAMQVIFKADYQLKIFAHDQQSFIFRGTSEAKSIIYLFLKDGHYDVLTSMSGFFNRSYWCETCEKPYKNRADHKCNTICTGCFNSPPCTKNVYVTCADCNRYFPSRVCFDKHKVKKTGHVTEEKKRRKTETSTCDSHRHCRDCGQYLTNAHRNKHVCNSFECPTCKKTVVKGEHLCYMQPLTSIEDNEEDDNDNNNDDEDNAGRDLREAQEDNAIKYVFFDFETTQCMPIGKNDQGVIYKHITNLCIAHTICDDCRNSDTITCKRCGPREKIFKGDTCLQDFCKWLFTSGSKKSPVIAMAHNAKGFDGQFILSYLEKQGILKPKIIDKGLSLMSIEVPHVKIMDSLNFLPMALSSLPKSFGLEELAKGYFPHLFNRPENSDYIGPWPAKEHYGPDSMKEGARREFECWYSQQICQTFNFEQEIIKYCRSDVDILRRAAMRFRDMFLETTRVDPFDKSLTIASVCNRVYRTLFLKADTIGIIPHGGYRTKQLQSIIGLKWIRWIAETRGIRIEHARNGGEYRVEPYNFLADGRCGKEIFEFNGCYWHGCPRCMIAERQKTADQQLTAKEAYTKTVLRRAAIEKEGFVVTEMWGCDLELELKVNPEMKEFFDSIHIIPPMDPREAFFGGRTNAVRLYACIEKDPHGQPLEYIQYMDVCSLYPYICKYGRFPIGHPEIITENFLDLATEPYEGLIKCTILPPRRLRHPVIPYRSNGKLTFPLCAKCADEMQQQQCNHSNEERAITGCWVTLELYKALKKGYRVTEIYEVYHYERVALYDPATKSGGLFAEYTNMFVKMKQEADGWPGWVRTEVDKDRYIEEYEQREGVRLDKDNIVRNPGLRSMAKLMLNSFWGKFGQRNNKRKTQYYKDPADYFKCITDPTRVIHTVGIVNEHMVRAVWSMMNEFVEVLSNTNPVIAAYTTAQARLKLYSYIEQLDNRLIYFDTDSVIFKSRLNDPDEYRVPTGSYLGDMTDELKDYGAGAYIEEFTSTGPKSYAMKIYCPKDNNYQYIVKAKGISLTSSASKEINFDTMKKKVHLYVKEGVKEKTNIDFFQIARTANREVVTKPMRKGFRVVYTKRVVQQDFNTLPYGY